MQLYSSSLTAAKLNINRPISNDPGITVIPFLSYQLGFETSQRADNSKRKEDLEKELIYYKEFLDLLEQKIIQRTFRSKCQTRCRRSGRKRRGKIRRKKSQPSYLRLTLNSV